MESIISTFHIDWKIIIAQMINFGVVFVVLYLFAFKPLIKIMTERSQKIAKGVDDAKTNAELLLKAQTEYDEMLLKAKAEANKIFQDGKKETENKKMLMLEEAKNEVSTIIENSKKVMEVEKIKMVEEIKKEIISISMLATEKLLGGRVDESFDKKTIKEFSNL